MKSFKGQLLELGAVDGEDDVIVIAVLPGATAHDMEKTGGKFTVELEFDMNNFNAESLNHTH